MEEVITLIKQLTAVIEGLQAVIKQHNTMFLDVYERSCDMEGRVAKLEREAESEMKP